LDINKHQDLLTINWNLIFSVITVLVLILILKHFFFEKVKKFMDERKAQVEEQFQKADEAENQARKKLDKYNEILAGAEKEKRAIIAGAMENAKIQADSVLDEARKEAADIREKSRIQIEREKAAARKEIHNEASELAVQVAEKILENKLDADAQASVIDEIISRSEANSETEK
jgi:ATP synthase F0, B subunit